jgi:hypothetical protein
MNVQGGYLHGKVRLVFIEQIHMSTCTLKAHYIAKDFVYQQPIRLNVGISKPFPVAFQWMVKIVLLAQDKSVPAYCRMISQTTIGMATVILSGEASKKARSSSR